MKKLKKYKWLGVFALLLGNQTAWAQSDELIKGVNNDAVLLAALWATFITLLVIFVLLAAITFSLLGAFKPQRVVAPEDEKAPFWHWFWIKFNAAVPKSKEKDILLNHNYDGIHELDNDLPPWWKYGFYVSIVFGVIYLGIYHGGNEEHTVSVREYIAQQEEAEIQRKEYLARIANLIDESNVETLTDENDLVAGQNMFTKNCRACHGSLGEGTASAPNLTDQYWLHGGGIKDIFKTIKYGVPGKGMISWEKKFTPKQIQQIASYIRSIRGSNPPNAKEPQGIEYKEEDIADEGTTEDVASIQ